MHRHPITRSISQTDCIGLIMVHGDGVLCRAQLNDSSLLSFVTSRAQKLWPRLAKSPLQFLGPDAGREAGVSPAKSRANLENPANRCASAMAAHRDTRIRTPISPSRPRVTRLPVNEPGSDLHRLQYRGIIKCCFDIRRILFLFFQLGTVLIRFC